MIMMIMMTAMTTTMALIITMIDMDPASLSSTFLVSKRSRASLGLLVLSSFASYANEKLHKLYMHASFSSRLHLYEEEGIIPSPKSLLASPTTLLLMEGGGEKIGQRPY